MIAKLKAGIIGNFQTDTLAGEMDREFTILWQSRKDIALPDDQDVIDDRRMLFVAIARGTLKYIHNHLDDIGTTTDRAGGVGTDHDHQLEFDWE